MEGSINHSGEMMPSCHCWHGVVQSFLFFRLLYLILVRMLIAVAVLYLFCEFGFLQSPADFASVYILPYFLYYNLICSRNMSKKLTKDRNKREERKDLNYYMSTLSCDPILLRRQFDRNFCKHEIGTS
jgi:hypothetical protein